MDNLASTTLLDKREFVREIIAPTTWGKRLANALIDFIFSSLLTAGLMFVFTVVWASVVDEAIFTAMENMNSFVDHILTFAIRTATYYIPLEYFMGKTIGKMITRTKVVTRDGEKAELGDIVIRNLARIIPFDALSFFSENPVGWHDKAGNTIVVDDIPLYNLEDPSTNDFYGEEERY
jgi:uncharacterized RDD family membrane protein YckC